MARLALLLVSTAAALAQSPSIGVFMDFDNAPGAPTLQVMETEVTKLLKPSGITLDWRLVNENHGDHPFAGLVVLKFKGRCKVEGWSRDPAYPKDGDVDTLGATQVVNGRVLPFSEVECDQVRKALAYLRPEAGLKERQRALGLIMGRVVAHELYHVLARTTTHAARGLAKAEDSLQDLVSRKEMPFQDRDSRAIHDALIGSDVTSALISEPRP